MPTITLKAIIQKKACRTQVEAFHRIFGTEVEVNDENAKKVADKWEWFFWAANKFLDKKYRDYYLDEISRIWATQMHDEYRRAQRKVFVEMYLLQEKEKANGTAV